MNNNPIYKTSDNVKMNNHGAYNVNILPCQVTDESKSLLSCHISQINIFSANLTKGIKLTNKTIVNGLSCNIY